MEKNILLKGVGAYPGIAIGKVFLLDHGRLELSHYCLNSEEEIGYEIERFKKALLDSKTQLLHAKSEINKKKYKEAQYIIDTHILLLEDRVLIENTIETIKHDRVDAAWALKNTIEGLRKHLADITDEYIKERTSDIDYIEQRILRNLSGKKDDFVTKAKEKAVIVASDLSPAETINLNVNEVLGFVLDCGGKTSHTAIMARALKIPSVVGLKEISRRAKSGDTIIVDGIIGVVIINPDQETILQYRQKKAQFEDFQKDLFKYRELPAVSRDGFSIKLLSNIEIMEELPSVIEYGAEGIGLYRTEFLYLNRRNLPTEEELFEVYKKVAEIMAPNPVTIRTLDIGGDKFISRLDLADEINPVMGLRAIRFCLKEISIFKTQLRAILRASSYGRVKIMFPMISCIKEVKQIKGVLEEVKEELYREKRRFNPDIEIGIMVEVPSAATIADILAKEVNFFSIGTNDLIQYALAIDRVNEQVSYLYEPLHPAVLRLIRNIIDAAHYNGINVAMCGEMAAEPSYIPILLGMGIDELSMNTLAILRVKRILRSLYYEDCRKIVEEIFKLSTAEEIKTFVEKQVNKRVQFEFLENKK